MSKNLVTYFSAEGNTEEAAKKLAQAANADLFEIRPKVPYTKSDINWKNPLSRCNKEKIGKKDIEIAGMPENINEYDTIFVGFPIWYYSAPNIIKTFLKNLDLKGKKVALFATSGGSDIKKVPEKLSDVLKGAQVIGARLFSVNDHTDVFKAWVGSL